MANHYITKETKDRLYSLMREKGVTSSDLCRVLNTAYPDLKAALDGRSPMFNKWQKKIAETLGVDKDDLFKEVNNRAMTSGNLDLEKKWESTVRADERAKTIEDCKEVVFQYWKNETIPYRIADKLYGDLEKLKEQNNG